MMLHLLEAVGIEAKIFNDHALGALGEIPFTHAYPEVWVMHDTDYPHAQGMVTEFESRQSATTSVSCGNCGVSNPANFSICWQCGDRLGDRY